MSDLADRLEKSIRRAIDNTPGINQVSERDYCEATVDALETVKFGLELRLEELGDDEE